MWSFFKGRSVSLNHYLIRGKGGRNRGVEKFSNLTNCVIHKESEPPVGALFKNRFIETKATSKKSLNSDEFWLGIKKEAQVEKNSVS